MPGRGAISRATRFIDGGRKRFLEYVQLAALDGVDVAAQWWEVFAGLKLYEQKNVSFDDICVAASVRPSELMAAVVATGMQHEAEVGDIVAASVHPRLVHAAGRSALRTSGKHADIAQKDRVAMLQHARFLPIPKNATMHVEINNTASSNAAAAAAASANPSVPSFMEDMTSLEAPKEKIQRELIGQPIEDGELVD